MMKRTSFILSTLAGFLTMSYVIIAQADMISIGDTGTVTEAWNPSKQLAENNLSPEQKKELLNAHKAHKDRLDKVWFTFKNTYFMSVEHTGCDSIKRGTALNVTNIMIFNQTGTIVDTGVNFLLSSPQTTSPDTTKNCLAFVVRP